MFIRAVALGGGPGKDFHHQIRRAVDLGAGNDAASSSVDHRQIGNYDVVLGEVNVRGRIEYVGEAGAFQLFVELELDVPGNALMTGKG